MKVTIEFNLPEENQDLEMALSGSKQNIVLYDISQQLRQYLKYGHDFKTPDEVLEKLNCFFYDSLNSHNIEIF